MTLPKYADWQPCFWDYFETDMKRLDIVELGKGDGTIFLHKHFKRVVSIEYTRYLYTASWEAEGLAGHLLLTLNPPENIKELDDKIIESRGKIRPPELKDEATRLYYEAIKHRADVLFIDHGCHNRGEVLELAKKGYWKYIIVHDINFPYYAYQLESARHKTTYYREGQGTAILKLIQ